MEEEAEAEELKSRDNKSQDYLMQYLHGAGQEHGLRASTENVALAVALGAACLLVGQGADAEHLRQARLVARLQNGIQGGVWGEVCVNGPPLPSELPPSGVCPRLPNTASIEP